MSYPKPVALMMFNRPKQTRAVFERIARQRPRVLLLVSDGPRAGHPTDGENVAECRRIVENIDWTCDVQRNYAPANLGCRRRFVSGLSWIFETVEEAVIIEDDCLPTDEFFRFCAWGLDYFADDPRVGSICGSNLVDYAFRTTARNIFSTLISPWGWAAWRRTWLRYDPLLSVAEVSRLRPVLAAAGKSRWEIEYWINVLKHAVASGTTWDFQLQHAFFAHGLLSVVPARNLVRNIGYDQSSTHTRGRTPEFLTRSAPEEATEVMNLPVNDDRTADGQFDALLARTIWSMRPLTAARVALMNLVRFARI